MMKFSLRQLGLRRCRRRRASGWSGAATMTCGCSPMATLSTGKVARRPAHQADIDLIIAQLVDHLRAVADRDRHLDARILPRESGDETRRDIFRGRDDADGDAAAVQCPAWRRERHIEIGQDALDAMGGADHLFPGDSQPQAAADAIEQSNARVFFKQLNSRGQRRRRDVKLFRGLHNRAGLGNGTDAFELFDRDTLHPLLLDFF